MSLSQVPAFHLTLHPMMSRLCLVLLALASTSLAGAREYTALLGTYTGNATTDSRGIYAVRLDAETGALSTPELVAGLSNPEFLALNPNGRIIYALTQVPGPGGRKSGAVAAFALEPGTGRLTPLNVESSGRGQFCHLAVDATGRMVIAASYGDPYVASFPLAPDGRVGPVARVLDQTGPLGPQKPRQDAPHPHSVTLSPDNRFAFVANLGVDRVFAYELAPESGGLAPHDPAFTAVAPGAGPRHTKFSPDEKSFYVLDELDNTVTACRFDAVRGIIEPIQGVSTLPDDFTGGSTASEIRIHPNGRFVYTANRGHNSIAVFARDGSTGLLVRVENVSTGGQQPRNFSLSPDGAWLLCANQATNNLTVFKVDARTGRLTPTPHTAQVAKAVCVLFLP